MGDELFIRLDNEQEIKSNIIITFKVDKKTYVAYKNQCLDGKINIYISRLNDNDNIEIITNDEERKLVDDTFKKFVIIDEVFYE